MEHDIIPMQDGKTDVISLRIDETIRHRLEDERDEKEITLNKLVSQILTRHVRWYKMAEKMDMITMPKTIFKEYVSKISDDEVKEIAKGSCTETFRNYTLLNTGELEIKTFLETLNLWFTINKIHFEHIITNDENQKYVIRHDMGLKFSIMFDTILSGIIEQLSCKYTNINMTAENLSFEITNMQ